MALIESVADHSRRNAYHDGEVRYILRYDGAGSYDGAYANAAAASGYDGTVSDPGVVLDYQGPLRSMIALHVAKNAIAEEGMSGNEIDGVIASVDGALPNRGVPTDRHQRRDSAGLHASVDAVFADLDTVKPIDQLTCRKTVEITTLEAQDSSEDEPTERAPAIEWRNRPGEPTAPDVVTILNLSFMHVSRPSIRGSHPINLPPFYVPAAMRVCTG